MENINGLKCKEVDAIFSHLKILAEKNSDDLLNEIKLFTMFLESEAYVNAGVIPESTISDRMLICSQNASHQIAIGSIAAAIHEIWYVIDYHKPEDELTVVDIVILSILTQMLYDHLIYKNGMVF